MLFPDNVIRQDNQTSVVKAHAATRAIDSRERILTYIAACLTALWVLVLSTGMAAAQATDYLVAQACTSQDVQPTVGNISVTDICDGSPGDTVTIDFGLTLNNNTNTTRYDILFGFSDGLVGGDVHIATSDCAQQIPGSTTGDLHDIDTHGDCDDLVGSASGVGLTSTATFQCDTLGDGATVNLAPATWWTSQSNNAAQHDGTTLIDGPKCFVDNQTVTVPLGADIELYKVSEGGTGTFNFTLSGTGVTATSITTASAGVATVSADDLRPNSYNGTSYTAPVVITETSQAGWNLTGISCEDAAAPGVEIGSFDGSASYTIPAAALSTDQTIICTATNDSRGTLELTKLVEAGGVAGIPGADAWELGYNDGGANSGSATGTATTPISVLLPQGDYTITEALAANGLSYDATLVCGGVTEGTATVTDGSTTTLSNTVTVTAGATTSCTVTNTLQTATLTLDKTVQNGTATGTLATDTDWNLSYDGPGAADASGAGGVAATVVPAGVYALSETANSVPAGLTYNQTDLSCTAGSLAGQNLTLGSGDNAVCTFTNTLETATLTLVKTVVDANDIDPAVAGDWELDFVGPNGVTESGPGGVSATVLPAGDFTIGENGGSANYALTSVVCSDGVLNETGDVSTPVATSQNITLADGDDVTCTFTNTLTDARLTIAKSVVDNSTAGLAPAASAWTMGYAGAESGTGTTPVSVNIPFGDYDITEQLAGNTLGYDVGINCTGATPTAGVTSVSDGTTATVASVTLAAGADVSCTVTNTLQTASLQLVKQVENGSVTVGLAGATDWDLSYAGPDSGDMTTGDAAVTVPAGAYTLSEAATGGLSPDNTGNYTLTGIACTGTADTNGNDGLDLAQSDSAVCTFTNTINKAQVSLVKDVTNPAALDGVILPEGSWDLTVNGGAAGNNGDVSVTNVLVDAGSIALTESAGAHDLDYSSSLACVGASGATVDNAEASGSGSVTVAAGDDVTCTFTNDVDSGTLTLVKTVPANVLGVANTGWDLSFAGQAASGVNASGVTGTGAVTSVTVPADTYDLSEALNASATDPDYANYTLDTLVCNGVDVTGTGEVTVNDGDNVTCTFTNTTNNGRLTLVKADIVTDADVGTIPSKDLWVMSAAGTTPISGTNVDGNVTSQVVTAGSYTISEQLAGSLYNYDAAMTCTGTSDFTSGGATVIAAASTDVGTVTVDPGEDITCTITNTLETADLTLVKAVAANDLGVVAEGWDLSFDGPGIADGTGENTEPAITSVTVPAGAYSLSEALNATGLADPDYAEYSLASLVCTGSDADGSDGLTLADDESVTCTFTNTTTKAHLTLVKAPIVGSVDAGTVPVADDWTLSFAGPSSGNGSNDDAAVTDAVIEAGSYTVSEMIAGGVLRYGASLSCTGATSFADAGATVVDATTTAAGTVEIAAGQDVTCTITNTLETATLTLEKTVPANALGVVNTDWDLSFDGPGAADGTGADGAAAITSVVVPAGTFGLSETLTATGSEYDQYGLESLVCNGTDVTGTGSMTVNDGDNVTCIFTNTPNTAQVVLIKTLDVPAAYAALATPADAWELGAGAFSGNNAYWQANDIYLAPGDYALTETNNGEAFLYDSGITCSGGGSVTDNGDGSGSLNIAAGDVGEVITCTFANRLETATLELTKVVENGAFGTATASDWPLSYTGPEGVSDTGDGAVATVTVPAGDYTISEGAGPASYALTSVVCSGNALNQQGSVSAPVATSQPISLADGDTVSCTFTNTIATSELTLLKDVTNDSGGTLDASAFTLSYGGTVATQGAATEVASGIYALTEGAVTGYAPAATPISCQISGSGGSSFASPNLTLNPGDSAVCTFFNDDIAPTYDMAKTVSPTSAAVGDTLTYTFTFTNNGDWAISDLTPIDTSVTNLSAIDCGGGATSIATLAAGAQASCSATYVVTQEDVDGSGNAEAVSTNQCASGFAIVNQASSTATESAPDADALSETDDGNNTATVCLPVQGPSIDLVKTGTYVDANNDGVVNLGDRIDYAFTVTNNGNVSLVGVMVTDPLVTVSGSAITLAPNEVDSDTFTATYDLTQDDIDAGQFENIATVTGMPPVGDDVTDTDNDVQEFAAVPSIALEKSGVFNDENGDGFGNVGETISYSFTVTNTGNVTLSGVSIDDPLVSVDGGPVVLAPGAVDSDSFTATYVVTQDDLDAGEVPNIATVSGAAPSDETVEAQAEALVELPQAAELELLKAATFNDENGDGFGDTGETITYNFTVTNVGNVTVSNITIDDPLIAVVGGPIPSLAPGESDSTTFTATYPLTQADIEAGTVLNIAIATGTDPEDNPVEDESDDPETVEPDDPTVEDLPFNPDFEITNVVDEPVVSATLVLDEDDNVIEVQNLTPETLTYTITVPNTGNVDLAEPELDFEVFQEISGGSPVAIPLASGPTLVSGDTDGDGELDVDETWVYTATVTVTEDMVQLGRLGIDSLATFDARRVDPQSARLDPKSDVSGSDVATDIVRAVITVNELTIEKRAARDTVRQGDLLIWVIDVANTASSGSEVVTVTDTLPTGFYYRAGTATIDGVAATPIVSGNTITFANLVVPAGQTVALQITTLVGGSTKPGIYVNRALLIDDNGDTGESTASVVVGAEPVFDCGTVIGKVFDDRNQNGYQDAPGGDGIPLGFVANDDIFDSKYGGKGAKYTPPAPIVEKGEPGIPGVRLVTVKGEIITTDQYGRFHVGCADLPRDIGSNFTLKIDTRSLPSGYRLTTENPRVVRLTAGKMTKVNFGATISRLVRIDVAANAFQPGSDTPKPEFAAAIGRAVMQFHDRPSTVRISYVLKGEDNRAVRVRMRNVEQVLRQYWRKSGKYKLMVEKTVQKPR